MQGFNFSRKFYKNCGWKFPGCGWNRFLKKPFIVVYFENLLNLMLSSVLLVIFSLF